MSNRVLLLIGTRKGLWLAHRHRGDWEVTGPHLPMAEIYAVAADTRGAPRLLVGASSTHFGPSVVTSDDLGATWQEPEVPLPRWAFARHAIGTIHDAGLRDGMDRPSRMRMSTKSWRLTDTR